MQISEFLNSLKKPLAEKGAQEPANLPVDPEKSDSWWGYKKAPGTANPKNPMHPTATIFTS